MIDSEKVLKTIFSSIDEINEQLPVEGKMATSVDASLFGDDGTLDSLGLISLITTIEQRIEEDFGMMVTLLEDIADLGSENPFRDVKTLTEFVVRILEKKADG